MVKAHCRAPWRAGLVIAATSMLVAACGLVKERPDTRAVSTFLLEWSANQPAAERAGRAPCHVLVVEEPRAAPGFATPRMAYMREPHRLEFYAYHEWADRPGRMLLPLLIRAQEHSGLFRSVAAAPSTVEGALRLESELLRLVQMFGEQDSTLHLEMRIRLVIPRERRLLASRIVSIREPVVENGPYGGVLAANRAVDTLLRELRAFVKDTVDAHAPECRQPRARTTEDRGGSTL